MCRWSTRSGAERGTARFRRAPGRRPATAAGDRAGFTLIELLAVLFILSILAYFLVTNLAGGREVMEIKLTRARIASITAALEEHAHEHGDYPPTTFADPAAVPNDRNLGAESLFLALCREGGPGEGQLDQQLCNSDGDVSARRIEGHGMLELHEIADHWDNPIAYIHHRDYGREDAYVTQDPTSGEPIEGRVRARVDPKLGRPYQPRKFQLISAGPNGVFGDEDDITSSK